jgi:pimeloyl-ACP methyl ester carboxylesterase
MPTSDRAGLATYWTRYGQGARPALMIHCGLAHSGAWARLAGELSGALDMVAFDLPGHGRSADWPEGETREIQGACVDIAAGFLDRPTDLIGHSFGATVALRLTVERPQMVRSLTLIEPVFFAVAFHDHPEARAEYDADHAGFQAALKAGEAALAAEAFNAIWGQRHWADLPGEMHAQMARQMRIIAATHPALCEDLAGLLQPGRLEAVDIPALLVQGSTSPAIMGAICEGLSARLPRAQRAMVLGAGHMLPLTHARQTGAEILRFLQAS